MCVCVCVCVCVFGTLSRCVPMWDLKHPCKKPCSCVGCPACLLRCCKKNDDSESLPLVSDEKGATNYQNTNDGGSQTGVFHSANLK